MDDGRVKITAENKVTKSEKPQRQTEKTMRQIAKASLIEEVAEPKQMRLDREQPQKQSQPRQQISQ